MKIRQIPGSRLIGIVLALLVMAFMVPQTHAAEIRSDDTVVIEAGEVIDDDLIVAGETIRIEGTITGDLIAAGRTITMNGTVEGSAVLMGQSVYVNGDVDGSLYTAGYALEMGESAAIGRNAYFGGFSLNTMPGSQIDRSLYVGGYQLAHGGQIGDDLMLGAGAVEISGAVGGDVRGSVDYSETGFSYPVFPGMGTVPTVAPGLHIDPSADIGGQTQVDVNLRTSNETGADGVAPQVTSTTSRFGLPSWFTDRLGEFIGLMLIGGLIIYFLPRFLPEVADTLQTRPLPSLGWGALLLFIALPVGIIAGIILIILLTIIFGWLTFGEFVGAILGLTGGAFLFALFAALFIMYVIAKIICGYMAGRFILTRFNVDPDSAGRWMEVAYLALGVLIYEVLRAIPVVGWLVALIVVMIGSGAIFAYWLNRRRQLEKLPQPEAVLAAE
ncbi:MAG: hypothetical protein R3C44_12930 [Chloroflexota bacterium]